MVAARSSNPLIALAAFGQSPWLDYVDRRLLRTGELGRLIRDDGINGVTSNPAIFAKAIDGGAYGAAIDALAATGRSSEAIYEALAIADIREAADCLVSVHTASGRRDGLVSLEVSPALAEDAAGTVAEARRLWQAIGRGNAMIKVPGTAAGIQATESLVAEGINVNVTLLFSRAACRAAAAAHLRGLERRAVQGRDIAAIAGVASFFISRVDVAVDALLDAMIGACGGERAAALAALRGQSAIANARLAYQDHLRLFDGANWRRLAARGAAPQRLLWASTGTKNPAYRDVVYVEELIGPGTVNTLPPATLAAFREHGRVGPTLADAGSADAIMAGLAAAGIDFERICAQLLADGVAQFAAAVTHLLDAISARRAASVRG